MIRGCAEHEAARAIVNAGAKVHRLAGVKMHHAA